VDPVAPHTEQMEHFKTTSKESHLYFSFNEFDFDKGKVYVFGRKGNT
jgi:hypothetical protein